MTSDQILVFIAIVLSSVTFTILLLMPKKPHLRPRFLVVVPVFHVSGEDRKKLRDDLSLDTERDYVFVETKSDSECIRIMEIG